MTMKRMSSINADVVHQCRSGCRAAALRSFLHDESHDLNMILEMLYVSSMQISVCTSTSYPRLLVVTCWLHGIYMATLSNIEKMFLS